MSSDFNIKPFSKGVLKDIPPQSMPVGGLTDARGIRITDAYIERRKGYRRINDCVSDDYILGIIQFRDRGGSDYIFFGDRFSLYKITFGIMRSWDDGYPWWDMPGYTWDPAQAAIYQITPTGEVQTCPLPSESSSSTSVSSSSESVSSSSVSSESSSSSQSCYATPASFTGRNHRIEGDLATKWVFAPWGNNLIASNYEQPIVIIEGPAFDRYRTLACKGLRARIIDVFARHLIALDTVDYLDGAVPNRFWWSGLDDCEDFEEANPASEAGYETIEPNAFPITAGAKLRDSYCIYQQNMTHLLNYVGGTMVFSKNVANSRIGCLAQGLVQSTGDANFFFSADNIYRFDGYNFDPIGDGNNRWIFKGLHMQQISQSFSFIDRNTNEIWFVVPYESDRPNLACIYDITNKHWTFEDIHASAGCTQEGFDYPTIARTGFTASISSSSSSSSKSSSSSSSSASSSSRSSSSSKSSSSSRSSSSSASTAGSTYYVTATGAGSKSGTSLADAMDVAAHNASTFLPDDLIIISDVDGPLPDTLIPPSSGTNGHPIVYDELGMAEVRCMTTISSWTGPDANGEYTYDDATTRRVVTEDDVFIPEGVAGSLAAGEWDYSGGKVYYKPSSGTPSDHAVRFADSDYALYVNGKNYLTFNGIDFYGNNTLNYGVVHVTGVCAGIILDGCTVKHAYTSGIRLGADTSACIVRECDISECTGHGIANDGTENQLTDNNITDIGQGNLIASHDREGIAETGEDTLIDGNYIYNCGHPSVGTYATGEGIVAYRALRPIISHNKIDLMDHCGIVAAGGTTVEIFGNVISRCGQSTRSEAGFNSGIRVSTSYGDGSTHTYNVFNNTLDSIDGNGTTTSQNAAFCVNAAAGDTAVVNLKNNIISHCTGNFDLSLFGPGTVTLDSDYNCWHRDTPGSTFRNTTGLTYTFANWQTLTGGDANSITTDPTYVSAATRDYRLLSPSGVIDAGTSLSATYDDDILGLDQDLFGAGWEMGAYAFSSSSSSSSSFSSSSLSSSSSSKSSSSSSTSSSSTSEYVEDASSYLMDVGVTDNDDDFPRASYWITGEYTFSNDYQNNSDIVKELMELWPVVEELSGDVQVSIGTRMRITDPIVWTSLGAFTDQSLMGLRAYGKYISFKFEANDLDDYYRISEVCGRVRLGGRR